MGELENNRDRGSSVASKKNGTEPRSASQRTNYRSIARDLERALAWLESFGLALEHSRLAEYRRCIDRMADAVDDNRAEALLSEPGEVVRLTDAMLESVELCTIHQSLAGTTNPEVRARLKKFVKGPLAYRDEKVESAGNRARNYGFELSLGAMLIRCGIDVRFRSDGDLSLQIGGREVFIECKRPQAERSVNSNVKGALRQLEVLYEQADVPQRARGLVALSATKVINPRGKNLVSPSRDGLARALAGLTESFVEEHRSKWRNPRDSRTLGCLVELRSLVFIETDSPTTAVQVTLNDRNSLEAADRYLLRSVSDLLDPSTTNLIGRQQSQ